jgi:hypothetical protein
MALTQNVFSQIELQGKVTDLGSDPIENALVELIDQADTTRTFSDYTDVQGNYTIMIEGTGVDGIHSQSPGTFRLLQNYPNPFNPSTVIEYELARPAHVTIEIYNVLGQKIKTLFDGFQSARAGRVVWDATDDLGKGVSAGIYISSLTADNYRMNKKMLLVDGLQGDASNTLSPSLSAYINETKTCSVFKLVV